jgi:hypothetical protein
MKRNKSAKYGITKIHPRHLEELKAKKKGSAVIAAGFTADPSLDMTNQGGHTIAKLSFKNFYLDGSAWSTSDMTNIDSALSKAMSDPVLNSIIKQYFPGNSPISTSFLGSEKLTGPVSKTFTRDSVNPVLQSLLSGGQLAGIDFNNTVICLLLPPGITLTDKAKGGVGQVKKLKGDDDKSSSKQGLGGYHGSCHLGATRVYFAVSVYSQFIGSKPNGIPMWPDSWKNIVGTLYHELNEARTDPDVEDYNRSPKPGVIGWYANVEGGGEIGDIPINEATHLSLIFKEVKLSDGTTSPIQFMWSNRVHGPEGPPA